MRAGWIAPAARRKEGPVLPVRGSPPFRICTALTRVRRQDSEAKPKLRGRCRPGAVSEHLQQGRNVRGWRDELVVRRDLVPVPGPGSAPLPSLPLRPFSCLFTISFFFTHSGSDVRALIDWASPLVSPPQPQTPTSTRACRQSTDPTLRVLTSLRSFKFPRDVFATVKLRLACPPAVCFLWLETQSLISPIVHLDSPESHSATSNRPKTNTARFQPE